MGTRERAFPLGSVQGIDGDYLLLNNGRRVNLDNMFGGHLDAKRPIEYEFIKQLCEEIGLLRLLLKQAAKTEHIPIVDSNEFHRNLASIAHKINCDIDSVRNVMQSILEQLVTEMFASRPPKKERGHPRHRGNGPRTLSKPEVRCELQENRR